MFERKYALQHCMQGLFVGDALSMPVHWYYRPADIWRAFPPNGIERMEAAPAEHPSSIMSLHSQQGGGRTASNTKSLPQVVGSVILKGREQYWNRSGVHYHHGMPAGENTLNAWCARLMMQWITHRKTYDANDWLDAYIHFMTADPPSHPDTYAESYHREFFANWQLGVEPTACGGVTHDTPSMGALVTVAPLALAMLQENESQGGCSGSGLNAVQEICCAHVALTHPDQQLLKVVADYVGLLYHLIWTDRSREELFLEASGAAGGGITQRDLSSPSDAVIVGQRYSLACYISDSWPSVCYLAARYWQTPAKGLLNNTNLGGENAHRGAVLGTLLGAAARPVERKTGENAMVELFEQLRHHKDLTSEIEQWVSRVG